MKKDFVDLTPKELNDFLINDYGVNICLISRWAHEIACNAKIIPGFGIPDDFSLPMLEKDKNPDYCLQVGIEEITDPQILTDIKKKISNLENKIKNIIPEIEAVVNPWSPPLIRDSKEFNEKLKESGLEDFFFYLKDVKFEIDYVLAKNQSGAPINRRNLLCSMWALYLVENNKTVKWELIADLMDWFWARFAPHSIYIDFKPPKNLTDPEYLKNQFYKHKKRWESFYISIRRGVHNKPKSTDPSGGHIIVFGQKAKEIDRYPSSVIESHISKNDTYKEGSLWKIAQDIYASRAKFDRPTFLDKDESKMTQKEQLARFEVATQLARQANLNWLVIFPDGTYAIDPE